MEVPIGRTIVPAITAILAFLFLAILIAWAANSGGQSSASLDGAPTAAAPGPTVTSQAGESPRRFLEVFTPADESVIRAASVRVEGRAAADSFVTVNGLSADVDETGRFEATIDVPEGPSVIEVIAGDFRGAHEALAITVIRIS